ncbi:MAG: MIP/aquaporin family protein [Pirellulaceae bacterium]
MHRRLIGEFAGTFLLVLFGVGAVHSAVLTGAPAGIWQVAVVWAIGIAIAIYCTASLSGAHLNPAVTIALATFRRHTWNDVVPYILAQTIGAFVAAFVLNFLFAGFIQARHTELGIQASDPGGVLTAMCYGEYFPNPGLFNKSDSEEFDADRFEAFRATVDVQQAFVAELLGTAILVLVIFSLTDPRNRLAPQAPLNPVLIGLTVAALIVVLAPLTQACFNPARDFGPRLFAWLAGWGENAMSFQNDWNWLTVYIMAPVTGGLIGGALHTLFLRPTQPAPKKS